MLSLDLPVMATGSAELVMRWPGPGATKLSTGLVRSRTGILKESVLLPVSVSVAVVLTAAAEPMRPMLPGRTVRVTFIAAREASLGRPVQVNVRKETDVAAGDAEMKETS